MDWWDEANGFGADPLADMMMQGFGPGDFDNWHSLHDQPNQPPIPEDDVQDTVTVTGHRIDGLTYYEFMQRYGWLFDNAYDVPILGLGGGGGAAQDDEDGDQEETPVCEIAQAALSTALNEYFTALRAFGDAAMADSPEGMPNVPGPDAFDDNRLPTITGMRDYGAGLIISELSDEFKMLQLQQFIDNAREKMELAADVEERACSSSD